MKSKFVLTAQIFLLILSACNLSFPPPSPTGTPSPSPSPSATADAYKPCYYNWAYKDLPELNAELADLIQSLDERASAYATAFGEDCIAEDGTATFGALETDFYIRLSVKDLTDFEGFGEWIVLVMKTLDGIEPELIAGPQPGTVEFTFEKTEDERLVVRVPIQEYRRLAPGLEGRAIFEAFYQAPQ